MARVKQVLPNLKFMGDAMKAAAIRKRKEKKTEVENSNEEKRQWQNEQEKERKGLDGIFELNEYYYPYLIQEFYGSMKEVVKGESFSVRVKKKSQIVDVDFLASVLNLPNDGNRIGTFKDSRKLEGYDEKAFQLSIFPRKMAQMLFGESFGKFGDFGSYPQGTAGPSNAKAAGPSGVKISEVEEEEEEHVEAAEKVQRKSKLAEVEEVEKNDEKENLQKRHQKQNKNLTKKIKKSSSSHTKSNSSSENGKSEGKMVQDKKRRFFVDVKKEEKLGEERKMFQLTEYF
ncbi:hypothetical protein GH714_010549 [Hevea brasiliensis]|uniref:Uncharacterized protein n=1 Tax=Hevea brasiliensis TaxID=3981 RepID=A0A6A6KIE1_HEVBR|nr:hypothetical protein GH714_010549 [Hevea brasiliensis]